MPYSEENRRFYAVRRDLITKVRQGALSWEQAFEELYLDAARKLMRLQKKDK
jgi:hypothetical protein